MQPSDPKVMKVPFEKRMTLTNKKAIDVNIREKSNNRQRESLKRRPRDGESAQENPTLDAESLLNAFEF